MTGDDEGQGEGKTVFRPRAPAGEQRRATPAAGDATRMREPRAAAAAPRPVEPRPRREDNPRRDAEADGTVGDFTRGGDNPLLQAATPLLLLAANMGELVVNDDAANLKEQVVRAIRKFEQDARSAGVANEAVITARYVLCTFVDEAVMSTPWGEDAGWADQTTLALFHRETWGGKKFFQILDRTLQDPFKHQQLLELLHAILALGFAGMYQPEERGPAILGEIRLKVYRQLRDLRGAGSSDLSAHWQAAPMRQSPLVRRVPLWVGLAVVTCVLIGVYAYLYVRLAAAAQPINHTLATIGFDVPPLPEQVPELPPSPSRVSLKQLLANEEAQGLISVDELPDRSVVSLGGDGFDSGSAELKPAWLAAVQRVAAALKQLNGRVVIVGHTDDVPLRSFRFRDNYELSKARAQACLSAIMPITGGPARFEINGFGPDRPRFLPPGDPANRARNRRVEIVYFETAG